MSSPFTITAASAMILLDANRQAQMVFTFSNISGRAIRGRVQIVPQNITMVPWLSLRGPAERDFPMASTQQYTIEIRVPSSAAPGSYTFRLDAVSIENPDEEYTEGPSVTFTVPAPTPVVHSFSWKIPVAVLLVLAVLILGITVWPDGIFPPPKTPTLPVTIPPTIMQPTLPPSPVARPDLLLGDIRIERNPNDSYYKDMMIATLINQGTGEARGFSVGFTYRCPSGDPTISAGFDLVQYGYIAAKSRFTYQSTFHYACISRPPRLNLTGILRMPDGSESTFPVTVTLP